MTTESIDFASTAEPAHREWMLPDKIVLVVLLLVCAVSLLTNIDLYPRLWFDEGYKLNAAYTIVQDGPYATYTVNGYIPFDPGTSGGPADILPTALAIKLLGTTIFAARLTSVLYTLLAALSLYSIGRYLWGAKAALVCVLLVIAAAPIENVSFILMGRQSLSEATAFSLMVCGIWILTKGWEKGSLGLSLASGAIMGLGMLSKTQIAISLVPALLTVAAWRWWHERKDRKGTAYLFAPAVAIILIFSGWSLLGQVLTTPEIRQQNSTLLMDAIRTNLITDLFGRNLDNQGLLVVGLMMLGAVTNVARIFKSAFTPQRWIELLLVCFCVYLSIWFVVFSVGWPRYAFAGLVIGLLLLSRSVWQLFRHSFQSKSRVVALFSVLVFTAVGTNVTNSLMYAAHDDVQQAAAYIAASIPADAVIETWEWELDMLSQHRQYHHPPQALLFEAIRQNARNQSFTLRYDPLQANPDYLIIGTFGRWTDLYSAQVLADHFTPVAQFGVYEVYKRKVGG